MELVGPFWEIKILMAYREDGVLESAVLIWNQSVKGIF
jgi:hypothetical protein